MANLEIGKAIGIDTMASLAYSFGVVQSGSGRGLEYVKGISMRQDSAEKEIRALRQELSVLREERARDQAAIMMLQERVEDLEDALDAQEGLREAQAQGTTPWEDVKRELGL